jgi:hypothetical protein
METKGGWPEVCRLGTENESHIDAAECSKMGLGSFGISGLRGIWRLRRARVQALVRESGVFLSKFIAANTRLLRGLVVAGVSCE